MHFASILLMAILLFNQKVQGLNCFVCHSRYDKDCGDPFPKNGNSNGSLTSFDCDRVKKVGEGLLAASNALGGGFLSPYVPLESEPHVCYKITTGESVVRGCSKSNFCSNMTGMCEECVRDECNAAQRILRFFSIQIIALLVASILF